MKHHKIILLLLLFLLSPLNAFLPIFHSVNAAPNPGVTIQADGSILGTTNIVRNGDLYTFVNDVTGPLAIERDRVVIDGAGHVLTGANGRGIILSGRQGVTVKDTKITLAGGYDIDLTSASDCIIIGNTLTGSSGPMAGVIAIDFLHSQNITVKDNAITNFFEGLALEWSSGHTITDNTISNGIVGITITNTSKCTFRNNHISNCNFSISLRTYQGYQYDNDLDTSNTVDGKPIYYWVDVKGQNVPSDAAYIVLVRCKNILIDSSSPQGICLISTTESNITNVKMNGRGDGISLLDSSSINVENNILLDHAIGLQIEYSQYNRIIGNKISNHQTRGINLNAANNNLIFGNTFTNNTYAIAPFQDTNSNANTIAQNNFTENDFAITVNGNLNIFGNIFQTNQQALSFFGGTGSNITENTFANNGYALYFSGSSGNSIYLNNFLKNDHQIGDAGESTTSFQPVNRQFETAGALQLLANHLDTINFIPPPPPSTNRYDNGVKGNYWIDYQPKYPNATEVDASGIWNTPYVIYTNNTDFYPLTHPFNITEISPSPSATVPELPMLTIPMLLIVLVVAGLLVYFKKHKH